MKLALADLPAPFLAETRVVACGTGERWHDFRRVLTEAGVPDGAVAHDLPGALTFLSSLRDTRLRRIESVLDGMANGTFPSSLRKPMGPDGKLLLTEGRVALARSNDQRPAKMVVGFSKFATALADPYSVIRLPDPGASYDAEAVLVAILGRRAERVTEAGAARAVAGFTLMAEITDRSMFDEEARTNNSLFSKNRLGLSPFGPCIWIASPEELDPNTEVTLTVNGAVRQRFAVADFAHTIAAAVRSWSRCVLEPGDGVGLGAAIAHKGADNMVDSPIPIAAGDTIEVECAPIGMLRARFVS
jgi:2-keto-4-pentenoate hydratase/2-oxohepta-3-ene-1,7-dioic acid hydratase in catechol pathway